MKKSALILCTLLLTACQHNSVNPSGKTDSFAAKHHKYPLNQTSLSAYQWQLHSATTVSGQSINDLFATPDKPVTLTFNNSRIGIQNTCNAKGGQYHLTGKHLTVSQIVSTMMLCQGPEGLVEKAFNPRIEGQHQVNLTEIKGVPMLTLTNPAQDKLVFKGIATAETRYGSQGKTIYLEIAPVTRSCSAGVMQQQCLQVREVRYNADGLKTYSSSQWENFYSPIEGYQHSSQERVIIRLKQYPVKNPPADSSSLAYVLDSYIEREQIQ